MIKILLYLLLIVAIGGASAWLGQTWRLEGASELSRQETTGGILFETFKANAEAQAQKIIAERERDGRSEGSAILQAGTVEGRMLALEGQALRVHVEESGGLATVRYYLDPVFGPQLPISELQRRLAGSMPDEERKNVTVALRVLENSKDRVRDILADIRTNQAKRASEYYAQIRSGCAPTSIFSRRDQSMAGGAQ